MPKTFKLKPVLCWLFLCVLFLVSCDSEKPLAQNTTKVRLITLAPHLAELVASAGALDNLIGVVAYSDFPEKVNSIQKVGDAFKLDYETIIVLKPDYILAWKDGTPKAIIDKLKSFDLVVIETTINKLADIPTVIAQIANLTNTNTVARQNIKHFNDSLNQLKAQNRQAQTIFIETYHQPLYTVSGKHWISEAVSVCGYKNIFEDLSQLSAPISLEAVITKNPDTILSIGQQEDKQWQKWKNMQAVLNNNIINIHPDYFSRPSLRLLEGIKQLCQQSK